MLTPEVFVRVVTAFAAMGVNPDAHAMAHPAVKALPETPNAQTQTLDCPPPWDKWLNPQTHGAMACYWREEDTGAIKDLKPDQVVVVDNRFCLTDPRCLDTIEGENPGAHLRRNSKGLIFRPTSGVVVIKFSPEGDDTWVMVVERGKANDLGDNVAEKMQGILLATLLSSPFWGPTVLREIRHWRREAVWRRASGVKPAASAAPRPPETPAQAAEPTVTGTTITSRSDGAALVPNVPREVTWDDVRPVLDFLKGNYGPELVIASQEQVRQVIETAQAQGRTEVIEELNRIAQGLDFQDIWHLLRSVANLRQRALNPPKSTASTAVIDERKKILPG